MRVVIMDPEVVDRVRAERAGAGEWARDEVWDGVLVMPPIANNEHQRVVSKLTSIFSGLIDWDAGDQALPGANVSDRDDGWNHNYRDPDAVVALSTSTARDCGTHWVGGPDLLVEVASPGEDPRLKTAFYAAIGTRELLIVDRYPWAVELYQLRDGRLDLAGRSDAANPISLASRVLPITFQLTPAEPRPRVLVTHTATGEVWWA